MIVGRALGRVVEQVFESLAFFLLELGKRQLAPGPPEFNLISRVFPTLGIKAGIFRQIGVWEGKAKPVPAAATMSMMRRFRSSQLARYYPQSCEST